MESTTGNEGEVLWEPSSKTIEDANITAYMHWLKKDKGLAFDNYAQLWQWSVNDIENFWQSLWEYFKIEASQPYAQVLPERKMPRADWFPGAEHVRRAAGIDISVGNPTPYGSFLGGAAPKCVRRGGRIASSWRSAGRPGGLSDAQYPPDHYGFSGLCQHRSHMVQLLTGLRHAQHYRPVQTDTAQSAFCG